MRSLWWLGLVLLLFNTGAGPKPEPEPEPEASDTDEFTMSKAVVCQSIQGYEDYEPLPDAALTSDEKLVVYYRPRNHEYKRAGKVYRVHMIQDGRLRKKGQKAVLQSKDKMLDFEYKSAEPPVNLYLRNSVSLKGLKPGLYEFDIILHDEIGGGEAKQSVSFEVIPARSPEPDKDADASKESPERP